MNVSYMIDINSLVNQRRCSGEQRRNREQKRDLCGNDNQVESASPGELAQGNVYGMIGGSDTIKA